MRNDVSTAVIMLLLVAQAAAAEESKEGRIVETPISASDREHWSFLPLKRPALPAVSDLRWPRNPVDQFILAKLEASTLKPQESADRVSLVRRLTIDLTGLPPTPMAIDAFVQDRRPGAYERLVERLLAAPSFGEHQAQAWLDLARWAETDGFEHDKLRSKAWQYRNWVIEAINRDLPYDRFVGLQIAGDELQPSDEWARTATGFCLGGPDMPDINSQEERRHTVLNDITSTVGAAFLGLQFTCAQCHDHKYDPISQGDFYRLRAMFVPAVDFSGHVFREGKFKSKQGHYYIRGDFRRKGPQVEPEFPRVLNPWGDNVAPAGKDAQTSTRRKQLAKWLTRGDHPLTSRVMVNRIWQQHFGRGLCETPSDFGLIGHDPEHKALLDWLAVELVESGWSTKHIRRMIVTSATYRQRSRAASAADEAWQKVVEVDPDNRLWSRYPRRRLTGETLRDMMLAVGDSLNRRLLGESVRPPLPREVVQTLLRPDHWKVSSNKADHYRRSIYIFARRNLRFPIFEAFDRPSATASCSRRSSSTIAPQSLMLLNSEFSLTAARQLAQRVAEQSTEAPEQVAAIYRLTLGRQASSSELSEAIAFLSQDNEPDGRSAHPTDPALATPALVDFCLAMLNTSEFVYLE